MANFEIGQKVKVTFSRIGQDAWVFESEVVDTGGRTEGVWVDHPELRGEDMLFINLSNPHINKVEAIEEEVEVERSAIKETEMKEARKTIEKALKWEEEDVKVSVKVYDCMEDQQSYDVEIQWAIGDDTYTDCVVIDSFYSSLEGDEVQEKNAVKRAKAVLKTVKGWFQYSDNIEVVEGVEVYHQ